MNNRLLKVSKLNGDEVACVFVKRESVSKIVF